MSVTMSSLSLTLASNKKLQGESNFRTWKADMQLLLQANNLDDYIDQYSSPTSQVSGMETPKSMTAKAIS